MTANPEDVLPIDEGDLEDIQSCAAYVKEIYTYLLQTEEQYKMDPNFLQRQTEISSEDRTVLLDWLSRAHSKFNLANESYFHTIALFDRLLELVPICKCDLKVVGMACLLIASKYEQSYIPSLRHYVDLLLQDGSARYCNCEQCQFRY